MPGVRTGLERARRRHLLVRVYREGLDGRGGFSEGFVVGLSPRFVVLHRLDPAMLLDGYSVLHVGDITAVERAYCGRKFQEKALALRGQAPKPPEGLDLSSLSAVLMSAGARFPLLAIHRERLRRDACWIGQVASLTDKTFVLREIDTEAEWDGQTRYRFRDVTLVEFGGSYEQALALVSGLAGAGPLSPLPPPPLSFSCARWRAGSVSDRRMTWCRLRSLTLPARHLAQEN